MDRLLKVFHGTCTIPSGLPRHDVARNDLNKRVYDALKGARNVSVE